MKLPKYLFFLFVVFLLSNCKKDDGRVVIDPCIEAQETTADFGFFLDRYFLGDITPYYIAIKDTFYNNYSGSFLIFRAKPGMDEYNWTIGEDPRVFHDSLFALNFYGTEGRLNVTLTTRLYEPSSLCFPEDTGMTTLTKSIYIKRRDFDNEQWPINGVFRGADEDTPDSIYTVSFTDLESQRLVGFPYQCDAVNELLDDGVVGVSYVSLTTPRQFHIFPRYNTCWAPKGIARLDDDDNNILIIDYIMNSKSVPNRRVSKRFVGHRVE